MFKQDNFVKYLVQNIKNKINTGESIDKDRAFSEIKRMSEEDGMLESLANMIRGNVKGSKNKVNSYLAFIVGVTSKEPDGEFKPHFKFELARVSHPDIDIDFDFFQRDLVYDYLIERYGRENTGNIGTYQGLKAKAALRTAIKSMDPMEEKTANFELEGRITSLIEDVPGITLEKALSDSSELRELQSEYSGVFEVAKIIEGLRAAPSKHPAGIVISDVPIKDIAPLHRLKKDDYATQFEMVELEDLGLIKFDVLSLKTLSVFDLSAKSIYDDFDIKIDIENIPVNDTAALNLVARGKTDSVFQLEGYGMKKLLKEMQVDSFKDVAAANALFRPGALAAGAHEVYCEIKKGQRKVAYAHPVLIPILKETHGQLIYQEQAMLIAQELAG